jgi:hypothetical protein
MFRRHSSIPTSCLETNLVPSLLIFNMLLEFRSVTVDGEPNGVLLLLLLLLQL